MTLVLGAGTPPDMTITGLGAAGAVSPAGAIAADASIYSRTGFRTDGSVNVGGTVEATVVRVTGVEAPADASLDASQVSLWFDDTDGAGKLMVKAKTANGTVASGSVTLT